MARTNLFYGVLAAVLALGVSPASAQRTNSSGESTGTAVSRSGGGEGGGAVSQSGDAGVPAASGTHDSGIGGGAWTRPSPMPGTFTPMTAPTHPAERQQRRRGGDEGGRSGGDAPRAVPRGSADSGPVSRPGGASTRSAGAASGESGDHAGVPTRRRRGERPQAGTAVDRRDAPGFGGRPTFITYPRLYSPARYYWPGYGLGLGYFYDPLWYDPFFYGSGYHGTSGYYGGYYGGSYGGYGGGSYGSASYTKGPTGAVRLKVSPREAEVYVDGYYAGVVDDFDGMFQKLTVDAGARRLQIRAAGFEAAELDVLVAPGETITYEGELTPLP